MTQAADKTGRHATVGHGSITDGGYIKDGRRSWNLAEKGNIIASINEMISVYQIHYFLKNCNLQLNVVPPKIWITQYSSSSSRTVWLCTVAERIVDKFCLFLCCAVFSNPRKRISRLCEESKNPKGGKLGVFGSHRRLCQEFQFSLCVWLLSLTYTHYVKTPQNSRHCSANGKRRVKNQSVGTWWLGFEVKAFYIAVLRNALHADDSVKYVKTNVGRWRGRKKGLIEMRILQPRGSRQDRATTWYKQLYPNPHRLWENKMKENIEYYHVRLEIWGDFLVLI